MPMGKETNNGDWGNSYAVQFPFTTYDARHFFYGQKLSTGYWFIQELQSDGTMGAEITNGYWKNPYEVQFPFTIKGRTFFYGHGLDNHHWFIQELRSDGTMGDEIANGSWKNPYAVQFPFWMENTLFFFGHNLENKYWFIQTLLPGGKMGEETDHGFWDNAYDVAFPFQVAAKTYAYGHSTTSHHWTIQELQPDGTMGDRTDHGHLKYPCKVQFPYNIRGDQYFYGQDLENNYWFTRTLLPGGKMGEETANGYWKNPYAVQFPFEIGGHQFFYGNNLNDTGSLLSSRYHWFIQELLKPGKAGGGEAQIDQSDEWVKVYIWSYRGVFEALGHASLLLNDKTTYISWWPEGKTPKTLAGSLPGFAKAANNPQTYDDDVRLEKYPPDTVVIISGGEKGLNISNIKSWWTTFRGNKENKYHLLGQNCAKTVTDALVAGGAWDILGEDAEPFKDISIWAPWDTQDLASELVGKIDHPPEQDGSSTEPTPSRQDRGEADPDARPAMA